MCTLGSPQMKAHILVCVFFFCFFFLVCLFLSLSLQEKSVNNTRKAVEEDLELINKEKQQKINELDVVIPLRLHQVNNCGDSFLMTKQVNVDKTFFKEVNTFVLKFILPIPYIYFHKDKVKYYHRILAQEKKVANWKGRIFALMKLFHSDAISTDLSKKTYIFCKTLK